MPGFGLGEALSLGSGALTAGGIAAFASRRKRTGSGKAFQNALIMQQRLVDLFQQQSLDAIPKYFERFAEFQPQMADIIGGNIQRTSELSPVYKALQERLVGELGAGPDFGAENAVRGGLRSALAARGILDSSASALPEALGVLNFREQLRSSRINSALAFLNTRSPTAVGMTGLEGQFAPPGFGDFATIFNPAYQGASDIFGFKTGQREAQLRDYTSALTYFDQRVNELFGGGIGGSVEDDSGGGFGGAGSVYGVLGGL